MTIIRGRIGFQPKPHQHAVLISRKRHRGVVMHRRAGKTVTAVYDGFANVLSCNRPSPRGAYIAPFLKQAKKLAWDYFASAAGGKPDLFDINRSDLMITFLPKDARIMLLGADNIDSIRGMYFDWVCVDELADCDPRLWSSVLRPALADRRGRALMMGTPKGRMNMLYDLSRVPEDDPEWSFHLYDHTQTGMIHPDEIAAMRREMSEAMFKQELECSFDAALVGAIYGKEMERLQREGRLTVVRHDETLPVYTAWDLGWRDATAVIYLQHLGTEFRVIEYEEYQFTKLPDVGRSVLAKPYEYAAHFGPHDLRVTEMGSGRSREELLAEVGVEFDLAPNWGPDEGAEAVRAMLPHLWIDEENAKHLCECLVNYRFEWQEDRKAFKTKPLHDWTSHGESALRMFATAFDGARLGAPKPKRSNRASRGRGSGDQGWLI